MNLIVIIIILCILIIALLIVAFRLSDQNAQLRAENLELRDRLLRGRYEY